MKLLKLKKGDSVLDLGCGYGRHCIPLAHKGLKVTGIDISKYLLRRAKSEAGKQHLLIEYKNADMRKLPFENMFDAIVNNYQSFGFFKHEDNEEVFSKGNKRRNIDYTTLNKEGLTIKAVFLTREGARSTGNS